MSFLRPSFEGLTRSFGAAALVLGAVSAQIVTPGGNRPPAQPVPAIQGDWSCGNIYYVAITGNNGNNGSLATPWRTVTFAVAQALSLTPTGTPITINVKAGLYTANETFPITLPARGIKLQAFEEGVVIRGQSTDSVLLVNQNGALSGACGFTPDTVIRGLTLREGVNGVAISIGGTPLATPDRVCVQRCRITQNIMKGILLETADQRRSQHVIEENEIDHNTNSQGFGHGIRGSELGDSSCLIRANHIHDNEVGIEITGDFETADRARPRIVSNIVHDCEVGISAAWCSSYIVNNTQAFGRPFSSGVTVYGVTVGEGNHVVVNNIIWNPLGYQGADAVIDYEASHPLTVTKVNNWILAEKNLIADDPRFVAPPIDLHLLSNSPLLEIGTNSFVLPVINITAGSLTVRADVGMDFDGDSRVLDTDRNASATVEIGADERSGGAMVRLGVVPTIPADVDAFGNVHTGGVAKTIGLVLSTLPNDLCVVYIWNPDGADQIDKNTFVDPFGNWRIDTGTLVGSLGFANGAGLFTVNLTLDPAVLGLERQVYVQAIAKVPGQTLGTITNRLLLEVNQ